MDSKKFGETIGKLFATTIALCASTICIALTVKLIIWMLF